MTIKLALGTLAGMSIPIHTGWGEGEGGGNLIGNRTWKKGFTPGPLGHITNTHTHLIYIHTHTHM